MFKIVQEKTFLLGVALALFMLCGSVAAQFYDDPGLARVPVLSHPQDYKPLGIRAGTFMLHPGMTAGMQWTDNVFYADQDLKSDTIFHVRPYITAQSTWSRHSFNARVAADFARYAQYTARNYEDYFTSINGRVDVKTRSYFTYSADWMRLHQGLDNRTSQQGVNPTVYYYYGGRVGYDHTFNRLSVGAYYGITWLDYDNVVGLDDTIINNQDQDQHTSSYGLRLGYQFAVDKQLFISYNGYATEFKEKYDRNGYDRSGDGYTINMGVNFNITGRLQGDIYASYYDRSFDDPRLPSNSGWLLGGGAGLEWSPTDLTTVHGRIYSAVQNTTDANSTSYLQTLYSVRVDHELTRSVQLNGFASYSVQDYAQIDPTIENTRTKDNIFRAGVGFNWFINRNMYLNGSYGYSRLDSSVPNDDYTTNDVWLLLGLEY